MILAVDPSIACTGYAVLADDGGHGRIVEMGAYRTPANATLGVRARAIVDRLNLVLSACLDVSLVVVETPQTFTRHRRGTRSSATLPSYGVAVGAVLAGLDLRQGVEMLEVSASEWTVGMPRTRNDDDKSGRVRLAELMWGLEPGALGARSVAGNVADAILLASWAMARHREITA